SRARTISSGASMRPRSTCRSRTCASRRSAASRARTTATTSPSSRRKQSSSCASRSRARSGAASPSIYPGPAIGHPLALLRRRASGMKKLIAAGAAALALAFYVDVTQAQQLKGEYKLGVLEPLTGNLAVQGKLHLEGYEIMRDLINSHFGGVMGRKLVLVVGDAPDPTAAASEAT